MSVAWIYVAVMAVSGGLAGSPEPTRFLASSRTEAFSNFAGDTGFDAIALALLGRSNPIGVLFAGLLFGASAGRRASDAGRGRYSDRPRAGSPGADHRVHRCAELVRAIYRIKTVDEGANATSRRGGAHDRRVDPLRQQ